MISTVTITTVTTIASIAGMVGLGVLAVVFLIILLTTKELVSSAEDPGKKRKNLLLKALSRFLNVAIIPLIIVFALIVVSKVIQVLH